MKLNRQLRSSHGQPPRPNADIEGFRTLVRGRIEAAVRQVERGGVIRRHSGTVVVSAQCWNEIEDMILGLADLTRRER